MLVNMALFVINLLVGSGGWFYWPLIGWGIGLGVHDLAIFALAAANLGVGTEKNVRQGSS